jgi:CheY-like chemotaxis protein
MTDPEDSVLPVRPQLLGNSSAPILVVEDSDEDFETLTRLIQRACVINPIFRCCDGEEALDFLNQAGSNGQPEKSPRPSLVLLDLNLPGTDGREVLQHIKENAELSAIPVVILSTSSNPKDLEFCYGNGANSYLVKPMSLKKFQHLIQIFIDYWFEAVTLPNSVTRSSSS